MVFSATYFLYVQHANYLIVATCKLRWACVRTACVHLSYRICSSLRWIFKSLCNVVEIVFFSFPFFLLWLNCSVCFRMVFSATYFLYIQHANYLIVATCKLCGLVRAQSVFFCHIGFVVV